MVHLEKCTGGGSDDCSKVHTIEQTNSNCAKQQLEREEGQQGIDGQGSLEGFFYMILFTKIWTLYERQID